MQLNPRTLWNSNVVSIGDGKYLVNIQSGEYVGSTGTGDEYIMSKYGMINLPDILYFKWEIPGIRFKILNPWDRSGKSSRQWWWWL